MPKYGENLMTTKRYLQYTLPICMGVSIFFFIYGYKILNPENISWLLCDNDSLQHYLGWIFYRDAPWTFPIGWSPNWGLEAASSIMFADALPVFAIPFKIFRDFLPHHFQYYGIWFFLCYILQACFSYRIALLLKFDFSAKIATVFFLTFVSVIPALAICHHFHSMTGHFVLLWAISLYFMPEYKYRLFECFLCFFISLCIHPYFPIMVFILLIADFIHRYMAKKIVLMRLIPQIFIYSLICIFVAWQIGIIGTGTTLDSEGGFGIYNFTISSFISTTFIESPFLPHFGSGGACYLGFAIILIYLFCLPYEMYKKILKVNRNLIPLCIACIILFCISLGSSISFFNYKIELFEGDEFSICRIFRAPERFIWPVYYMILLYAMNILNKISIKNYKKIFILFFIVLQIFDFVPSIYNKINFDPKLMSINDKFAIKAEELIYDGEFWNKISQNYTTLRLLNRAGLQPQNWQKISYISSQYNLKTNVAYLARINMNAIYNQSLIDDDILRMGNFAPDTIYIFEEKHLSYIKNLCNNNSLIITQKDNLNLLIPNGKSIQEQFSLKKFDPQVEEISFNKKYIATRLHDRGKLLYSGWSYPETEGIWTNDKIAKILFYSDKYVSKILLDLYPFIGNKKNHKQQRLNIYLNDKHVLSEILTEPCLINIPVARVADQNTHLYEIRLELPDATSPSNLSLSNDRRILGVFLKSITLLP